MAIRRKKTNQASQTNERSDRKEIKIEISMTSESNFYCGVGRNISELGIFVSTNSTFYIGNEIDLEFNIPNTTEYIKTRGTVQWIREFGRAEEDLPAGIGVKFTDLEPRVSRAIGDFVNQRDPTIYD